jgi:hypothetical protein
MPRLLNPKPGEFTREEKIEELLTTLKSRHAVYPKRVKQNNMKHDVAERRMAILMSIAVDYGWKEKP